MFCVISFSTVELLLDYIILDLDIMIKNLFLFFAVFITIQSPALAQYDGDTETVEIMENSFSLFPRHFYTMELFNNPQISESKFTLRLAAQGEISGCNSMYESYIETKKVGDTLKISVSDSEIMLDDDEPRYSNYDCEIKNNRSFFDLELDRDELMKNGTKKIAIESDSYGKFKPFDIDVNKQRITLSVNNKKSTFMTTYWFFPKNTVILHASKAKLGQNVQALIKEFGESKGLIHMEDHYKDFELPYNANSYAFFIDPTGKIVSKLFYIGENITVGTISPTRTIYDANGAKEDPYELEISATLPGKKVMDKKDKYNKYDKYLKFNTDD